MQQFPLVIGYLLISLGPQEDVCYSRNRYRHVTYQIGLGHLAGWILIGVWGTMYDFHSFPKRNRYTEKYMGWSTNMKNILTPHNFPQIQLFPTLKIIGSDWHLFLSMVEIFL